MKKKLRIVLLILLLFFVAIQFYQPALNIDKGRVNSTDFTEVYKVPDNVGKILRTSCYDCHSNNTKFVWYDYLQPVRTLVANHIKDAKKDLNFSEWRTYSDRKQERLLNTIKEQVENKQMPLSSYTVLHRDAKLNEAQIKILTKWLGEQQ